MAKQNGETKVEFSMDGKEFEELGMGMAKAAKEAVEMGMAIEKLKDSLPQPCPDQGNYGTAWAYSASTQAQLLGAAQEPRTLLGKSIAEAKAKYDERYRVQFCQVAMIKMQLAADRGREKRGERRYVSHIKL